MKQGPSFVQDQMQLDACLNLCCKGAPLRTVIPRHVPFTACRLQRLHNQQRIRHSACYSHNYKQQHCDLEIGLTKDSGKETTIALGMGTLAQNRDSCVDPSRRGFLALACLMAAGFQAPGPASAYLVEEEITDRVFRAAGSSVVAVVNMKDQRGGVFQDSEASGFVWDSKGYIVTNYHCIQPVLNDRVGNMYTVIRLGKAGEEKEYRASIRATDSSHDLAVLYIDAPPELLMPIPIGTSGDLRVGQSVFSIGSPYGLSKTFTAGVVSGLNRGIPSPAGNIIAGSVQTDASINSGNSGGPLLDSGGRLIGISTATFNSNKSMGRGSGVNFAVSVDTLMKLVPNMIVYANSSGRGV